MTKQQFYEKCIVRSYIEALDEPKNVLHKEAQILKNKLTEDLTFAELQLARALAGFDPKVFPDKQPFDKLGSQYLFQIMSFVYSLEDNEMIYDLFAMLKSNPKLVDFSDPNVAETMYEFFYDGICGSYYKREFSQLVGSFFLKHGKAAWKLHGQVLSVLYALGRNIDGLSLPELIEMRKEHEEKDGYCVKPKTTKRKRKTV